MTLTRWDPLSEMLPLRQLMDRLLEDAVIQPSRVLGSREGAGAGSGMTGMGVALDLAEHENELVVTASLPGVRPEDVDISIQDNVLTIQGEVREERQQPTQTTASTEQGQEGTQTNGRQGQPQDQPHSQQGQASQGRAQPQYHYRERRVGRFLRQVTLTVAVNADKAEASFEHGVLTLRLPKAEEAQRKRIQVRSQAAIEGQTSGAQNQKELTTGTKPSAKSGSKA